MKGAHQPPQALSVELRVQQPGLDIQAQFRALPGETCALAGHAGAGKTALMRTLAGLQPAQSGRIALGPYPLYDSAAGINRPPHQRRLAWLDDTDSVLPHLNVQANLKQAARLHPDAQPAWLADTIAWLGLEPLLQRPVRSLHAGQRLRVALARTALAGPNAVLMDDPLRRVPSEERPALLDLLADLPRRLCVPVVLVTPRMNEVVRMASELIVLHEGRMTGAGPAARMLSDVAFANFLEGADAGSVLEGQIVRHDVRWMLTEVDVGGQRITVPAAPWPIGSSVRLKIRGRDVSLHQDTVRDTTHSNQLRGRIAQVMLAGEHGAYGAVTVALLHPQQGADKHQPLPHQIWAMLTRKSIQEMNLAPGQDCVVGFKAMAVSVSGWRQA